MVMDKAHEVNVISVLFNSERGVLLSRTESGKWGFPGSEDLVAGEDWETAQGRGLDRDLGEIQFENISILHLESYPAGTVGPRSKFGVFVFGKTDSAPREGESLRWVASPDDVSGLDLVHPRVLDLVAKALKKGQSAEP